MTYTVRVVDDDALPTDHDWAVVTTDAAQYVFVKRSAFNGRTLAQMWAGARVQRDARQADLRIA